MVGSSTFSPPSARGPRGCGGSVGGRRRAPWAAVGPPRRGGPAPAGSAYGVVGRRVSGSDGAATAAGGCSPSAPASSAMPSTSPPRGRVRTPSTRWQGGDARGRRAPRGRTAQRGLPLSIVA